MGTRVVVQPAAEPITLAVAKLYCRVDEDDTAQDALISTLITAARMYGENRMRRALVHTVFERTLTGFENEIKLLFPELRYVESIKYTDTNGNEQTVAATVYQVDTLSARVKPAYNKYWPNDVRSSDYNAVRIRYAAGYEQGAGSPTTEATLTANIPEPIKLWLRARVVDLYENRGTFVTGTIVSPLPRSHIDAMLDKYITGVF